MAIDATGSSGAGVMGIVALDQCSIAAIGTAFLSASGDACSGRGPMR